MSIVLSESLESIDWDVLSQLYMRAPLGRKNPQDLEVVFKNSMYKVFAWD